MPPGPVHRRVRGRVARATALALTALAIASGSASQARPLAASSTLDATLVATTCALPHEYLLRTWRGNRADRSPELQFLPHEPDFIDQGLPHVGPWPYAQDVPLFWYGPGHVAATGVVDRPVTVAGIAPTQGKILRFPFRTLDGQPMDEALLPDADPPKLLVTVVWDAGGRNVLARWPKDWSYLRSLIPRGTWYDDATVGSTPTSTAQIHATIGTGDFPDHHGIVGHRLRIGPELNTPWVQGPAYLIEPTLADRYDEAMDNKPIVGELGTVSIHLGMLGHGSMWGGGDRDIAIAREALNATTLGAEGFEWNLPGPLQPYFRFPTYLNDIPGFDEDVRAVDAADGRQDGKWRTNDIDQLLGGFDTPARIPYQTRVLETLIEREGFGKDDTPDLLFVNYKMIDYVSHVWTVNSPEMSDSVKAQDDALRELVRFLNEQVGQGEWAMVLTADHGSIPDPRVSGALRISAPKFQDLIAQRFDTDGDDTDIIELLQPTALFIDMDELEQNGVTLEDLAHYILSLTKGQVAIPAAPPPPGTEDEPAFEAAFPSSYLTQLPCLPEAREG
jgi:hypothetical protein